MIINYIGRHRQNNSDDEGAIEYALQQLGHTVNCVQELGQNRHTLPTLPTPDLVLFNHWPDCHLLADVWRGVPKVFWYFDLVDWPGDPTLVRRCEQRREWVGKATELCTHGFMTDGDWVAKDTTGKLHWLPQGADERIVGAFPYTEGSHFDILFTGIAQGGGTQRESFVADLKVNHGGINHVVKGVYREQLRRLIGSSKIVVAPDSPVSDRYWSNRVYNTLGFGGFMLHPYCKGLAGQYEDGCEVVYYDNRKHLHGLIRWYLEDEGARRRIARQALERTRAQHTYRRRCELLMAIVPRGIQ